MKIKTAKKIGKIFAGFIITGFFYILYLYFSNSRVNNFINVLLGIE